MAALLMLLMLCWTALTHVGITALLRWSIGARKFRSSGTIHVRPDYKFAFGEEQLYAQYELSHLHCLSVEAQESQCEYTLHSTARLDMPYRDDSYSHSKYHWSVSMNQELAAWLVLFLSSDSSYCGLDNMPANDSTRSMNISGTVSFSNPEFFRTKETLPTSAILSRHPDCLRWS